MRGHERRKKNPPLLVHNMYTNIGAGVDDTHAYSNKLMAIIMYKIRTRKLLQNYISNFYEHGAHFDLNVTKELIVGKFLIVQNEQIYNAQNGLHISERDRCARELLGKLTLEKMGFNLGSVAFGVDVVAFLLRSYFKSHFHLLL